MVVRMEPRAPRRDQHRRQLLHHTDDPLCSLRKTWMYISVAEHVENQVPMSRCDIGNSFYMIYFVVGN